MTYQDNYCSPLGNLIVKTNESSIIEISFEEKPITPNSNEITAIAISQLQAFFSGQIKQFSLPLAPAGTAFQQRVWQQLQTVPFGETKTYLQQAKAYGNIKAIRAVASANGKNPIAIVIPCHRIVGINGSLTGYAGGLEKKKWLLDFEQKNRNKILTLFNDYVS